MSSAIGLAISGFVITLSLLIVAMAVFTNVFSQKNTGIDLSKVDENLYSKSNQLSAYRARALRRRYSKELSDNKKGFHELINDYKTYGQNAAEVAKAEAALADAYTASSKKTAVQEAKVLSGPAYRARSEIRGRQERALQALSNFPSNVDVSKYNKPGI